MNKERLNYIDIAKALAVIVMVAQHVEMAIEQTVPQETMSIYTILQYYFFLTWFMAIFFVITGYCSDYSKSFKPFAFSLCISIGLPILFFDIIPVNINNFTTMTVVDAIKQMPITLGRFFRYSFWFLRALFVTKILFWLLCRFTHGFYKKMLLITLYLIACIAVINEHGEHGCHSLIALLLIASGHSMKQRDLLNNTKFCLSNLLIFAVLMISMLLLNYKPSVMIETLSMNYSDIILFPLVSISSSVSILYLCKMIGKCWALEIVGRYSLVVYCFHYYVNKWLNLQFLLSAGSSLSYSLLYLIIHVIITVSLCCIFAYIVDRPYLRVIIGKKP